MKWNEMASVLKRLKRLCVRCKGQGAVEIYLVLPDIMVVLKDCKKLY
jgi:hypothetical protein